MNDILYTRVVYIAEKFDEEAKNAGHIRDWHMSGGPHIIKMPHFIVLLRKRYIIPINTID